MTEKLKCCPFCDGKARIGITNDEMKQFKE